MVGLFKSETYDVFKDKKDGELVKGEAQPNVFIKCSVDLLSDLKEKDELTTKISIDDAIKNFDTSKLDKNLYIKNDYYLYYDNTDKCFYPANRQTGNYAGAFSYTVSRNTVNCIFVLFDENKGNGSVKNKLIESVPSIGIKVTGKFKWYKPSDIQTISPKLYDYIVNNI
jgi:hypothetical protein